MSLEALPSTPGLRPIFCSPKEAAQALDVSPFTVYRLLDKGELKGHYIGRSRKVLVESLYDYARGLPTVPPDSA